MALSILGIHAFGPSFCFYRANLNNRFWFNSNFPLCFRLFAFLLFAAMAGLFKVYVDCTVATEKRKTDKTEMNQAE